MKISPINNTNFFAGIVRVKKIKESRDSYTSVRNSILFDESLSKSQKSSLFSRTSNIYQNSIELDLLTHSTDVREKMKKLPVKDKLFVDAFNFKDGAMSLWYETNSLKSKDRIKEIADSKLAYELLYLNNPLKSGQLDKSTVAMWLDRLYSFLK